MWHSSLKRTVLVQIFYYETNQFPHFDRLFEFLRLNIGTCHWPNISCHWYVSRRLIFPTWVRTTLHHCCSSCFSGFSFFYIFLFLISLLTVEKVQDLMIIMFFTFLSSVRLLLRHEEHVFLSLWHVYCPVLQSTCRHAKQARGSQADLCSLPVAQKSSFLMFSIISAFKKLNLAQTGSQTMG